MPAKIVLRQSDFFEFRKCRRKFLLESVAGITQVESSTMSAANKGTFIHGGLTRHYMGGTYAEGLQDQKKDFLLAGKEPEQVYSVFDMASAVCEGYLRWVAREHLDEGLDAPIIVEDRLEMKVCENAATELWVSGQMDLVFPTTLIDFKTKDRIEKPDPVLSINNQLLTYLLLIWATTEYRPQTAVHRRIVRRAPTERSKAELFAEDKVYVTKAVMNNHWAHMQAVGTEILSFLAATQDSLVTGEYPHAVADPTPSGDCAWRCPFAGICPSIDKQPTVYQSIISKNLPEGLFT